MPDNSEANLFSRPRSDAPWWVLPILTFLTGIALTAAVLMPSVSTPDYKRGHSEGYAAAVADNEELMQRSGQEAERELRSLRIRIQELESLLASK